MGKRSLNLYVAAVVALGGAAVVHSLALLPQTEHLLEGTVFAGLALVVGSFMINVASIEASISVGDTLFIASALLFGPAPATVALAADSFLFSWRKRHAPKRAAFNAVAPALSMWVAAQVFFMLSGTPPLASGAVGSIPGLV